MAVSTQLALPYLESAQAQKHVTVNESLRALDALVHLSVLSRTVSAPPGSPAEGDRYLVASAASGDWAGQEGRIAAYQDGAWAFFTPKTGWRLYSVAEDAAIFFDGTAWRGDPPGGLLSLSAADAATRALVLSEDHSLAAATTSDTTMQIPDRAIVLGVTARVLTAITGATSWDLGVTGATDRYGTSVGVALDSTLNGVSSAPVSYYAPTALRLTANGGAFTAGVVRLVIHYLLLTPPSA
ncbi:MAG: DUF2793 domain-containing protein [Pseudomonadota bacterium]